jgi:hypothetical protein
VFRVRVPQLIVWNDDFVNYNFRSTVIS